MEHTRRFFWAVVLFLAEMVLGLLVSDAASINAEPTSLNRRAESQAQELSAALAFARPVRPKTSFIVPSFVEVDRRPALYAAHGKNRDNWFKHNITPAERYKYLYSEREPRSVAANLRELDQRGVKRAYVIFNNCYQNFGIMNAGTMEAILRGRAGEQWKRARL